MRLVLARRPPFSGVANTKVLVVGNRPPPVTGMTTVTESLLYLLKERAPTQFQFINVGNNRFAGTALWKLSRLLSHTCIAGRFALARLPARIYLLSNSSKGLFFTFILISFAKARGCEVFLHHHVFSYVNKYSRLMNLIVRWRSGLVTHIMLDRTMSAMFKAQYGEDIHTVIVGNTFAVSSSTSSVHSRDSFQDEAAADSVVIGLLSNLTFDKGVRELVACAEVLVSKGIRVKVRFAGPIADEAVRSFVEHAAQRADMDVEWVGPVYGSEKDAFYRSIDFLVFLSSYRNEAQPLVILESLKCGVPVVGSDVGGIPELLRYGGGGVVPLSECAEAAGSYIARQVSKGRSGRYELRRSAIDAWEMLRMNDGHAADELVGRLIH